MQHTHGFREEASQKAWSSHAQEYRKVFRPHACDLQEFSAEQFQACLRGRRIIMIGDSTMRQLFQSLACLFTAHIRSGDFVVNYVFHRMSFSPIGVTCAV